MQPQISAMMAAPNSSRIKAKVLGANQSAQFPDKWELELEILDSQSVSGPNFARVGEKVQGFTFRDAWDLPTPVVIEADAEYIGGAQKGLFQLTNLRVA